MAPRYYSSYEFGTSPRKVEPEYIPNKKNNKKKKKVNTKKQEEKKAIEKRAKEKVKSRKKEKIRRTKIVFCVILGFGVLLGISYRSSVINNNFAEIKEMKTQLAAIEKENQQIRVNIESSLNYNNVEKEAKKLGMQKLTNDQKIYINLPKEDYIEPASEEVVIEENTNMFQKIINTILGK